MNQQVQHHYQSQPQPVYQSQYPAQVAYPMVPGAPAAQGVPAGNGLGVAGFVCGLIGLVFCWIPPFGLVLGLLGVVLGGAGMSNARKRGLGSGLAIAGLTCGIIALVFATILLAALA